HLQQTALLHQVETLHPWETTSVGEDRSPRYGWGQLIEWVADDRLFTQQAGLPQGIGDFHRDWRYPGFGADIRHFPAKPGSQQILAPSAGCCTTTPCGRPLQWAKIEASI